MHRGPAWAAPATPENDHGFAPEKVLRDGDRLTVPGRDPLQVVHTPGHASNHLCFLTPDGILATGDHIMQGSTVVILPPDGDMQAYLDSLERLKTLALTAIAPGHGTLIDTPHTEIERLIAHRMARDTKVANAVATLGAATIDELLPIAYDDVPAVVYPLARRSLEAHLIRLARAGAVVHADGRWQAHAPNAMTGERQ